jgi:hypothetical protein
MSAEEERLDVLRYAKADAAAAEARLIEADKRAAASRRELEESRRKAAAREDFLLRYRALAPRDSSLAELGAAEATKDERKRLMQEYRKSGYPIYDGDVYEMDRYVRDESVWDTRTLPKVYVFTGQADYDRRVALEAQREAELLAIKADELAGTPRPVHTVRVLAMSWWQRWGLFPDRAAPVQQSQRIDPRF